MYFYKNETDESCPLIMGIASTVVIGPGTRAIGMYFRQSMKFHQTQHCVLHHVISKLS